MADIWNDLTDAFNRDMAIDEMRKKYDNSYLVLQTPEGVESVVMYKGFDDGFHWFRDSMDMAIKLRHKTDYKVVCVFPERRLYNYRGKALEFIRLPNRQYRRGICKDNASVVDVVSALFGGASGLFGYKSISAALYPKYPQDAEEAIKILQSNKVASIALNESFAISQSISQDKNRFHFFYSDVLIGYFEKDTFFIKHELFRQEVMDNLKVIQPFRVEF